MGVIDILFIGIGLSMDAFAVSICKGLKMKVVDLKQCLMIAWFFGIFQAIMPTIGYVLSSKFVEYINAYSHWVTFVLLTIIGANMIRESVGNEEEETDGMDDMTLEELSEALNTEIVIVDTGGHDLVEAVIYPPEHKQTRRRQIYEQTSSSNSGKA